MGSGRWILLVALGVASACGETAKSPRAEPNIETQAGQAAEAGATGSDDTPVSDSQAGAGGGSAQVAEGGVGAEPSELDGTAGDRDHGGAASAGDGGAAGSPGRGDSQGLGGAADADECEVLTLDAPRPGLATTSLVVMNPLALSLGQGFQGEFGEISNGTPASLGCVTGIETNGSRQGTAGIEVMGSGTPTLGTVSDESPHWALFGRPEETAFNRASDEHADRSLWGVASTYVALWPYLMRAEQRSQVAECGNTFVRTVSPARLMATTFKLTFKTPPERDVFERCFADGQTDITSASGSAASRYLTQHRARLSISVLTGAGDPDAVRAVLAQTRCSTANLPACAETLTALERLRADLLQPPSDELPLSATSPAWGAFNFSVSYYSVLPD